jgi:hypothetical protein
VPSVGVQDKCAPPKSLLGSLPGAGCAKRKSRSQLSPLKSVHFMYGIHTRRRARLLSYSELRSQSDSTQFGNRRLGDGIRYCPLCKHKVLSTMTETVKKLLPPCGLRLHLGAFQSTAYKIRFGACKADWQDATQKASLAYQ